MDSIDWEEASFGGQIHNELVRELLKINDKTDAKLPSVDKIKKAMISVYQNHSDEKLDFDSMDSYIQNALDLALKGTNWSEILPDDISSLISGYIKLRRAGSGVRAQNIDIPDTDVVTQNAMRLGLAVAESSEKLWTDVIVPEPGDTAKPSTRLVIWTNPHQGIDVGAMIADDAQSAAWDYYNKIFSLQYWNPFAQQSWRDLIPGNGVLDSAMAGAIQSQAGLILGKYNVILQPLPPVPVPPPTNPIPNPS